MDKLQDSAADGKTKSDAQNGSGWVRSRVSSFILGGVGLGHFTCGSGSVGSRKLGIRVQLCVKHASVHRVLLR